MITAIDIHAKLAAAYRLATPWTSMHVFGAATGRGNDSALGLRYER
jgi:hypothetical protein